MNRIIREALDNIKKRVDLKEHEEVIIGAEIGAVMQQTAKLCTTNPNHNFKGGGSADENSYVARDGVMAELNM